MKRVVLVIVGILLLLIGLGSIAIGTGIVVGAGSDGEFSADAGKANGNGKALVFNDFAVDTGGNSDALSGLADLTVGAKSTNGKRLFIGVGPVNQVNQYLSGFPHDIVSDISSDNGGTKIIPVPGKDEPAPPMDQSFWTARAQGNAPRISIDPAASQTLVVMNADASEQVAIDLQVGVKSRFLFPVGIGLIVVGAIFVLLAGWAFVRSRKKDEGLPPGAYPPAMATASGQVPLQYPPVPPTQPYQPPSQSPQAWQPPTDPPTAGQPQSAQPPTTQPPAWQPPAGPPAGDERPTTETSPFRPPDPPTPEQ
ncbi:MAG: hypothetical protein ACOYD0_04820 [Candidatus Nanopelagicales bacterium]